MRGGEGGRAASADAAGHAEGGGDGAQDAEQRLQDEFPGLFLFHGAWGLGVKVLFFLERKLRKFFRRGWRGWRRLKFRTQITQITQI